MAMFPFDSNTDPKLREQILTYWISGTMTDSERARLLGLPATCRIREGAKIYCIEKFQCGEYVWIGEGSALDAQGGLSIGSYTQIGVHVLVWSHTSHWQALRGDTGKTRDSILYKPTKIGERCFIGGPSVVFPGVTIGDRVVVPPMTVVDQDLPSGTILNSTNRTLKELEQRIAALEKQVEGKNT